MNVTEGNRCYDDGKTTENRELFLLITFSFYVFEGFILVTFNGLLELILLKHRDLRRHYVIIFAQAFPDALLGIGLLAAGSGRIIVLLTGCYRRTRRSCLLQPWAPIITWSETMSATSTLMVSTDRLICCLAPMRYFRNSYSYQLRQIAVFFGSISLFILISWIFSFLDNESLLQGFCWTGDVLNPFFADFHSVLLITTASLSVALYVIVYLLSKKHLRRIKSNQSEGQLHLFEARQRKLTITMGISCVFTLIFFVIPLCTKSLIYDNDDDPTTYYAESIRVAVSLSCNINPIMNVAAILIRQKDISGRIRGLLPKCIHKSIYGPRKSQIRIINSEKRV